MNVKELIEALQGEDPDMEVHFAYNYGDHWRTMVAPSVGHVEVERLVYSEYHLMPKVIDDEEDTRYDDAKEAVVLR